MSNSDNAQQKGGVFLLFAHRDTARGGMLDLKGVFADIEAAKEDIGNHEARLGGMRAGSPTFGHIAEIAEGCVVIRAYYIPRDGWTMAQNETEWSVSAASDATRDNHDSWRKLYVDGAENYMITDLDPSGIPTERA